MNERIKLLADQARVLADEFQEQWKAGPSSEEFFHQKFAELIVQECVDIISPYTVRMSRPGEEYLHPINEIKKHFGVEE